MVRKPPAYVDDITTVVNGTLVPTVMGLQMRALARVEGEPTKDYCSLYQTHKLDGLEPVLMRGLKDSVKGSIIYQHHNSS